MKIAIGADHGGFQLKNLVAQRLRELGHEVQDFGAHGTESVDYPDYGRLVGEAVAAGVCERGVVVCGTGIGISIAANKVAGVRAALCTDCYMARMSRQHNDANVLALGGRVLGEGLALDILEAWLKAEFEGGRHARRVAKIHQIESDARAAR